MENQFLDSQFDDEVKDLEYATFGQRLGAIIIDGLIFLVLMGIVLFATGTFSFIGQIFAGISTGDEIDEVDTGAIMMKVLIGVGIVVVLQFIYFILLESGEKQGTLGKQAMGIIVTDLDGNRIPPSKAFIRQFVRVAPSYVPFVGRLYSIVDGLIQLGTPKKQTIHDMAAGTLVYKKPL